MYISGSKNSTASSIGSTHEVNIPKWSSSILVFGKTMEKVEKVDFAIFSLVVSPRNPYFEGMKKSWFPMKIVIFCNNYQKSIYKHVFSSKTIFSVKIWVMIIIWVHFQLANIFFWENYIFPKFESTSMDDAGGQHPNFKPILKQKS